MDLARASLRAENSAAELLRDTDRPGGQGAPALSSTARLLDALALLALLGRHGTGAWTDVAYSAHTLITFGHTFLVILHILLLLLVR